MNYKRACFEILGAGILLLAILVLFHYLRDANARNITLAGELKISYEVGYGVGKMVANCVPAYLEDRNWNIKWDCIDYQALELCHNHELSQLEKEKQASKMAQRVWYGEPKMKARNSINLNRGGGR